MKHSQLEKMKKAAEVNAVFADAKNVGSIKKQMRLDAVLMKISELTTKDIVDTVLKHYKPVLSKLPKSVRGNALHAFCDAVRNVISAKGALFAVDANTGNINPNRVLNAISKRENKDLFMLLSNLVMDAAADAEKEVMDAAAVESMRELLSWYKQAA